MKQMHTKTPAWVSISNLGVAANLTIPITSYTDIRLRALDALNLNKLMAKKSSPYVFLRDLMPAKPDANMKAIISDVILYAKSYNLINEEQKGLLQSILADRTKTTKPTGPSVDQPQQQEEQDDTMKKIGIGLGVIALLGIGYFIIKGRK